MSLTPKDQERIGRWHEALIRYIQTHAHALTTYDTLRAWALQEWREEIESLGPSGRAQADYALAATWLEAGPPYTTTASRDLSALVDRFLTWPVPADVHPDGIPGRPGRTGTNLLTATQARAMLAHVLEREA